MPLKGIKGGINSKSFGLNSAAEAVEETDAEFNNTVLLLHGDGSEGAGDTAALGSPNYKAFKDNSTSAHAITVYSDAYGNDFSPYYYADGYWSNSFTADSLKVTTASDFDLSASQEFSIEFWLHPTAINASWGIFFYADPNDNNFQISHDSSGNVDLRFAGSQIGTPFNLPLNTWSHLVITRDSSGYIRQFLDGVLKNYNQKTDAIDRDFVTIGDRNGGNHFLGYISNVRWVKDSIPTSYQTSETSTGTTVFTSPTAPVTTSSQGATSADVKLLTCQSNRFKDTSDNQTFTVNGTPKVSTNTPFTVTKTANVGSGFFDENGDYLQVGGANETDFDFGTNDFTVECWFYYTSDAGSGPDQHDILSKFDNASGTRNWMMGIEDSSGDKLRIYYSYSPGNSSNYLTSTSTLKRNEWIHGAWVCNNGTLTLYLNGVAEATATRTSALHANTKPTLIGATHVSGGTVTQWFPGYIADVRIVSSSVGAGGAVYTSDFTPPTSPLTAVTNTKLLTCQYAGAVRNVGFLDDSKYNHQITRAGDVSMGTFSPFSAEEGYWSIYFDIGSNSYITYADSSNDLDIGGADAHIEFWYRPMGTTTQVMVGKHGGSSSWSTSSGFEYQIALVSNKLKFNYNVGGSAGSIDSTTNVTDPNKWYHVAVATDSSNNIAVFIDGTREATTTNAITKPTTRTSFIVGADIGGNDTEGYISNLRHVSGSNAYDPTQSSITVPTEVLTAITGTQILTASSNRFKDLSTNNLTPTVTGTPKVLPFSPFAPSRSYSKDVVGGSAYFDGTGDYLESINYLGLQNSDFTIGAWVYPTAFNSENYIICNSVRTAAGGYLDASWSINVNSTGTVRYQLTDTGASWGIVNNQTAGTINLNEWSFIELDRNGSTFTPYVNGVAGTTTTDSGSLVNTVAPLTISGVEDHSRLWTGYIAEPFIIKGGRRTGVGTVPTAPMALDSDAFFYSRFNNAGVLDHTMRNNLETEANTRISGQQVKFGTGSIYFDGSGDYLVVSNSNSATSFFSPAASDFTWEMFVNFSVLSGSNLYTLFSKYGSASEYQFYYQNGSGWNLAHGATTKTWADTSIVVDTYYHIALVKDGTDYELFKDGTSLGTIAFSNPTAGARPFVLGCTFNGSNSPLYYLNGHLDEVRISRLARYISNFTPPVKAFANR